MIIEDYEVFISLSIIIICLFIFIIERNKTPSDKSLDSLINYIWNRYSIMLIQSIDSKELTSKEEIVEYIVTKWCNVTNSKKDKINTIKALINRLGEIGSNIKQESFQYVKSKDYVKISETKYENIYALKELLYQANIEEVAKSLKKLYSNHNEFIYSNKGKKLGFLKLGYLLIKYNNNNFTYYSIVDRLKKIYISYISFSQLENLIGYENLKQLELGIIYEYFSDLKIAEIRYDDLLASLSKYQFITKEAKAFICYLNEFNLIFSADNYYNNCYGFGTSNITSTNIKRKEAKIIAYALTSRNFNGTVEPQKSLT